MTVDSGVPLVITGERTVPGVWHENYWFRRHEAAYAALPDWLPTVPGVVLDAGCGEGYGAALLRAAWPGVRVVGVDYDPVATAHAARTHGGGQAAYLRAGLTALPLGDGVADLTVSLQVLEHLWTPGEYVGELTRVTADGGALLLTTPNRLTFSPGLGHLEAPSNAYHSREYDVEELEAELRSWLPGCTVRVVGLHHRERLRDWEALHGLLADHLLAPPQDWSNPVRDVVASSTAADFVVGAADEGCLDLVAVVRR
ncbi:MAG: class I SAM-dependent methyltransferase [Pedococcus sp.]